MKSCFGLIMALVVGCPLGVALILDGHKITGYFIVPVALGLLAAMYDMRHRER